MQFVNVDRILAEIQLEPIQGSRFQPTGFPSLGPAEFSDVSNGNVNSLLVESAQSMANRLELVCWNKEDSRLVKELQGMPIINVINKDDNVFLTNSLLEAHRMNSSYILEGEDKSLLDTLKSELQTDKTKSINIAEMARFALKYDPNSILHGLFISKSDIAGGRYKMTRSLSSFIEAHNIRQVVSGGVKLDHVDPKGGDAGAEKGFGHIPFSRTEYSAESITAFFNIDLALIKSYSLGDTANEFLLTLAMWKIQKFLKFGLRLRTACDLKVKGKLKVTHPDSVSIPNIDSLDKDVIHLIKKCKDEKLFTDKPITIKYKSGKAGKTKQTE